ncbi:trifunctional dihydropteroate synthetase [Saitozyma podzolica]|uniref:Trifunctional dihydropteroate synthetase n=1 Tax=Saitozyma podzolica TaxID=1890683 RepID=A0A427Y7Q8_9TREE|nr:trifunctional dihydropteroate synthetase [Saitozyma podzolica]
MAADKITVRSLSVQLPHGLGPSAFGLATAPPCPISVTLAIHLRPDVVPSCVSADTLSGLGVNYSAVTKAVYAALADPSRTWGSPAEIFRASGTIPLELDAVESVDVEVEMPRGLLHAQSAVYGAKFSRGQERGAEWTVGIKGLGVACVVGLHPHEMGERQRLEVDLAVNGWNAEEQESFPHKELADEALKYLEQSSFGTLEALAHSFAGHLLSRRPLSLLPPSTMSLGLTIRKPSALPYAVPSITPGVTASSSWSSSSAPVETSISRGQVPSDVHAHAPRTFIALGSNIGDRISHIRRAVAALQEGGCELVGCSRLYESEPMYVEDQERFINGAIEIRSSLKPLDLLRLLKRTERLIGRTKTFRNGPRVLDLDLVLYGDQVVRHGSPGDAEDEDGVGWLECPHPRVGEREFVLRPLVDIAPDYIHPILRVPLLTLLRRLPQTQPPALAPIIPFPSPSSPLRLSVPSVPRIMAIFNATPDSFSDGSVSRTETDSALSLIRDLWASCGPFPPDILDIGGMSTRPNSQPCSVEEEVSRVVPLIRAIRASGEVFADIPISVDTYRAEVARAAVEAGGSMINDVRGGTEEGMLQVMAEMDVPVVLMHSRGDSGTMGNETNTDYTALGGVVKGVKSELGRIVANAEKAGVKRWNIMVDPGLGFAKTHEGNLELLQNLPELEIKGYAMLVGASRKGFVGRVLEQSEARKRGFGDAAINAVCVASGKVDVLRVHEPREAGEVVRMMGAIRGVGRG